jgi:hypothetical protein
VSRNRSFKRDAHSYRRRGTQSAALGRTFLIVVEGEKTEPNYFRQLRNALRLGTAEVVVVHPEGTDPATLVREAKKLRDDRARAARKGDGVAYDDVWVVFDLEKPHDERRRLAVQAMNSGAARGMQFAVSDPCFEFWILLHFTYTTRPFDSCDAVVREIRKAWPDHSKNASVPEPFDEKVSTAIRHAQQVRSHHETGGGGRNPHTDVDLLVSALKAATRNPL